MLEADLSDVIEFVKLTLWQQIWRYYVNASMNVTEV